VTKYGLNFGSGWGAVGFGAAGAAFRMKSPKT
jgi:hypothetical protein